MTTPLRHLRPLLAALALAAAASTGFAQPAPQPTATPRIDARQAHQAARIANGQASGQLTHPEARRLKAEQRVIARTEARARSDGVVTAHERAHLRRMQNRASRDIHRQKHDAQTLARPAHAA